MREESAERHVADKEILPRRSKRGGEAQGREKWPLNGFEIGHALLGLE